MIDKKDLLWLKESNNIEEVWDDDSLVQAIYAWDYLKAQPKLTAGVILKTHKILMLHQNHLMPDERGYFRHVQVSVGGHEKGRWETVNLKIDAWCDMVNNTIDLRKSEPASSFQFDKEDAIFHHLEYENIHPFVDGNGRTGRLFMNWEMKTLGHEPIVFTHSDRASYYKLFKENV